MAAREKIKKQGGGGEKKKGEKKRKISLKKRGKKPLKRICFGYKLQKKIAGGLPLSCHFHSPAVGVKITFKRGGGGNDRNAQYISLAFW